MDSIVIIGNLSPDFLRPKHFVNMTSYPVILSDESYAYYHVVVRFGRPSPDLTNYIRKPECIVI